MTMTMTTAMAKTQGANDTKFGHSVPPEGPHTITTHVPGWNSVQGLIKGDVDLLQKVRSIYPRFGPFGVVAQLSMAVHKKLGLSESQACFVWACPDALEKTRQHACSSFRDDKDRIKDASEISETVVRIKLGSDTLKLHVIIGPAANRKAMVFTWQLVGSGTSTRLAQALLPVIDTSLEVVGVGAGDEEESLPEGLPEGDSHVALRRRILELLQRSPIDPARAAQLRPDDVYLYPSGMTAIVRHHEAMAAYRPGKVLCLGALFKHTWLQFSEGAGDGMKHFGACQDDDFISQVGEWLEDEYRDGRQVSYCFVEFPSNPILVSADLKGLRSLADKYNFPLVVDDTVGSFANIDVLPVADVIITSLTKSFSGYADVMGGSVVLNPSMPRHYGALSRTLASQHRNELFAADAATLVSNSADHLARSTILNRNAAALAETLARATDVVAGVNHARHGGTYANYAAFKRPATDDFAPGDACLLSVDFADLDTAVTFYNGCGFFHSGHLGAHRTLAVPFSYMVYHCAGEEEGRYHAAYGCRAAQVRLSAGLEDEAELVAIVEEALAKTRAAVAAGRKNGVEAGNGVA
ncbi:hypothetical protein MCOR27_006521 [Pyricularia oryzae]|uniref:Cystathionine gamma-synthase n=2 Tax=Pyricularia TaxID=48558 RepID=A0ABQ8NEL9_PYRGI|nr:hypothetical protein MCOR01_005883 [Pyricularia oryzae]KAI6295282.1 hypothetical protein MCOR33_007789 [Pyricularia grisea]KAH9435113.1 hypothetical protein MCOR02_004069 [Pyricularia oryzae]KAI6255562.1 hypothetical protein MCOR19_007959 [Pyricularia oryzae]KAI6275612.1 hypothetical protein MCOR26_005974 [Pyricularia oryzae]